MRSNSCISSKTCDSRGNFTYGKFAPMHRNMPSESTLSFSFTFPRASILLFFNQDGNDIPGGRRLPRKKLGKLPKYSTAENLFRSLLSFLPRKIKVRRESELKELSACTRMTSGAFRYRWWDCQRWAKYLRYKI